MYLIIYSPELINMGLGETCSPKACLLTTYLQLLFFTKLMQSNKKKNKKKTNTLSFEHESYAVQIAHSAIVLASPGTAA